MKKKIIILAASLLLIATGVSASSLNGEYNGNPIVKLKSGGIVIDPGEVPAMIYDGKTLVPISALRNLGATVEWNPNEYSVNVEMPNVDMTTIASALDDVASKNNGSNFKVVFDKTGSYSTVDLTSTNDSNKDVTNVYALFGAAGNVNVTDHYIRFIINGTNTNNFAVSHVDLMDFLNKKIDLNQFGLKIRTINLNNQQYVPPAPTNNQQYVPPAPTNNQQYVPPAPTNTTPNNLQACNNIKSQYEVDKQAAIDLQNRRGGSYSGGLEYQLKSLEDAKNSQLQSLGCTQ